VASRRIRRTKSLDGYIAGTVADLNSLKGRNNSRSIAASAVGGDSLADEVQIVDKSIQSSTYLAGADGWKIDGSGSAEFANVFVRGDINAETGTIGYWNISTPAVERVFGTKTLFGTFLESSDLGYSDTDVVSGTYVSLFKSYLGNPTAIDSISVLSDTVTIRAIGHSFLVGDKVYISFDDVTYVDYQKDTYVVITEATEETFSYEKPIADNADGTNNIAETSVSGSAEIYNEDIAGLYIRDYAKTNFDYGYFSNDGVAYVSATRINLVHNPSFEYFPLVTNSSTGEITYGSATASASGWDLISGAISTFSTRVLSNANTASPPTAATSVFGGLLSFGNSPDTDGLRATVNTAAAKEYNLFSNKRILYFDFDSYFYKSVKNPIVVSSIAANASTVTVTTPAAHGLVAGDLVYFGFDAWATTSNWTTRTGTYTSGNSTDYSFTVTAAPTSTTFRYDNPTGVSIVGPITYTTTAKVIRAYTYARSANVVTIVTGDSAGNGIPHHLVVGDLVNITSEDASLVISNANVTSVTDEKTFTYNCATSGTITTKVATNTGVQLAGINAYKAFYPVIDMNEIKIQFGSNVSAVTNLTAVVDSYDTAIWSNKRYRTLSSDILTGKTLGSYGPSISTSYNEVPALRATDASPVRISFSLLESEYLRLNSAGYDANENMYIVFPAWLYQASLTGTPSANKIVSTVTYTAGYILDDVHLSTSTEYFFGNSGSDVASWYDNTATPNTPSLKTPYKWIDVDLSTQRASYALDSIVFQNTGFSRPMFNRPGIFKADFNKYSMLNTALQDLTTDFSTLLFSGGEYEYTTKDRANSISQTSYLDTIVGENSAGIDLVARRDEISNSTGVRSNKKMAYLNLWAQEDIDTTAKLYADVVSAFATKTFSVNVNNSTFISADTTSISASASGSGGTVDIYAETTFDITANTTGTITTVGGLVVKADAAGVSSAGTLQIFGNSNSTLLGTNSPLLRIGSGTTAMLFDINSIQVANTSNLAASTMTLNAEGGNVYVAGTLTSSTGSGDTYIGGADGALYNKLTYSQAVSGRGVIVTSGGLFGTTSSSRETKQDISNLSLDIDSILSIAPVSFKYKRDVANLGEDAPTDWGMIAEDLHDAGLTKFVYYGENGEVEGIDYSRYVVALQAVVRNLAARLSTLEGQ
jgi:hypothetical protein